MRYMTDCKPEEPDYIVIHVSERLLRGSLVVIGPEDEAAVAKQAFEDAATEPEKLIRFFDFVNNLPGIEQEFTFQRYAFSLNKALLFMWEDILPEVLHALRFFVAKDDSFEEMMTLEEVRKIPKRTRKKSKKTKKAKVKGKKIAKAKTKTPKH